MKFGLTKATVDKIKGVFARFPAIEKAVLYGSRAKGNFKTGSDIDLTLYGESLTSDLHGKITEALDDLLLPYTIDLSLFDELNNAKLREHIERVGVVFYERAAQGTIMKAGWEVKKLGEVLLKTETTNPHLFPEQEFEYIDVSSVSNQTFQIEETQRLKGKEAPSRARRHVKTNDVLFATVRPTLRRIAIVPESLNNQVCSTGYFVLRPVKTVDYRYLYYFLFTHNFMEQMEKLQKGASYPAVTDAEVKSQTLAVPPLPEQKRIVAILDEVFEGIATAKAHAEKNLQNARELFDTYLQSIFANPRDEWEMKRFDEICILQRGFDLPTHSRIRGNYPLVSSNGITDRINLWKVKAPGVVTGRSGTIGNVHFIEEDYWPLNTALYVKEFYGNYEKCIYYFLKQFTLGKYSSGAGVPTLNRNNVHSEMVWFPKSLIAQQTIVAKLDALSAETKKLEAIYQQKLNALEELKKSVLQKAFSGELV